MEGITLIMVIKASDYLRLHKINNNNDLLHQIVLNQLIMVVHKVENNLIHSNYYNKSQNNSLYFSSNNKTNSNKVMNFRDILKKMKGNITNLIHSVDSKETMKNESDREKWMDISIQEIFL